MGGGVTRVQAVGIDDSRTFIVSVFFFFFLWRALTVVSSY